MTDSNSEIDGDSERERGLAALRERLRHTNASSDIGPEVGRRDLLKVAATSTVAGAALGSGTASAAVNSPSTAPEWRRVRIGGGGATPGIVAHPNVEDLYGLHTDVGTCYVWDSANQRWDGLLHHIDDDEWWLSAADSFAWDPNDTSGDTLYVTAGKYQWAGDGYVMKSTDRGDTFTRQLAIPVAANDDQLLGERIRVNRRTARTSS